MLGLSSSLSFANLTKRKTQHPIYEQILRNRPKINKAYAMRLSNLIHTYTKRHKIPANIYTAILAQESMYKQHAKLCQTGLRLQPYYESLYDNKPYQKYKKTRVCFDFGISMINFRTAKRYGFDINKLTSSLAYSVEAGVIVLKDFLKRGKHWTYYNARTKIKRDIYKQLVERYL